MQIQFLINTSQWCKGQVVEMPGGLASWYVHRGWASYCLGVDSDDSKPEPVKIKHVARSKRKRRGNRNG